MYGILVVTFVTYIKAETKNSLSLFSLKTVMQEGEDNTK